MTRITVTTEGQAALHNRHVALCVLATLWLTFPTNAVEVVHSTKSGGAAVNTTVVRVASRPCFHLRALHSSVSSAPSLLL